MGNKKATKVEAAHVAIKATKPLKKETVWSQIEASLRQIEIGGTEVECFKSFKRQEEMAASWKKNLEEQVIKQKETEPNLQARYGNLLSILAQG